MPTSECLERANGKFTSRKWIGFLLFGASASVMLLLDKITGQQWVDSSMWAFVIFAGANAASKFPSITGKKT